MLGTRSETYTGKSIDLAKPHPSSICIEDIAWHLSRLPRFGGATRSTTVYTVAQHSILVLNRVRQIDPDALVTTQIHALLHDAHEAYIGDVTRPMSRLLDMRGPIERLKARVQKAIWKGLLGDQLFGGVRFEATGADEVQLADDWALSYEAYHLMFSRGVNYAGRLLLEEEYITRNMIVWSTEQAHAFFLAHYRDLLS